MESRRLDSSGGTNTIGVMAAFAGVPTGRIEAVEPYIERPVPMEPLFRSGRTVTEGIYEFPSSSEKTYVGQSGNIPGRIQQHLDTGKLFPVDLPGVRSTEVLGGKIAREIAEQLRINELGGVRNLENI